jgi:hypothetical protein
MKSIFQLGEIWRVLWCETAHDHYATRPQDTVHFGKRCACVNPKMYHTGGENTVQRVISERHLLGRAKVKSWPGLLRSGRH